MKNNKKTPEIRFKGFTDDWEQRKLEDFGSFTGGTSIESEFEENGKYKVISIGSYSETSKYNDQGIRCRLSEKTVNKILNKEDLTMILNDKTASGNIIGRVLIIDKSGEYVYNQRTERIEPNIQEYYPQFLYHMLNAPNIRKKIIKQSQGNTQIFVNWTGIQKLEYLVPKMNEQINLAKLIGNLDNLITLHQRKYEKIKNIKQSLLEKMFPKNGMKIPEIRFKGFTDDWEQRKLGEIGNTFTGLSGKTKEDFGHGDAKFVTYMNVFSNPIAVSDKTESVEIDHKQNEVQYGDIFFTTSSETPEEVGMSSVWLENKENVYLNSFCFGYRPAEKNNPYYMAYMLRANNFRSKMILLAQGISRYNISKNSAMDIEIQVPKYDEQKSIGKLFYEIDNLITLHQRKYEKLKNIKQALLDKMFV